MLLLLLIFIQPVGVSSPNTLRHFPIFLVSFDNSVLIISSSISSGESAGRTSVILFIGSLNGRLPGILSVTQFLPTLINFAHISGIYISRSHQRFRTFLSAMWLAFAFADFPHSYATSFKISRSPMCSMPSIISILTTSDIVSLFLAAISLMASLSLLGTITPSISKSSVIKSPL